MNKFQKYIRLIQVAFGILFVLPILYLWLLSTGAAIPYIQLSTLHELILINGELFFFVTLFRKYLMEGWGRRKLGFLLRDFLIINCIFLFPFLKFYTNPVRTEIPVIDKIRPYLIYGYIGLVLLTVIFLYALKDIKAIRTWINAKIEAQQIQDRVDDAAQDEQFQEKFHNLAKIPVIGIICQKIYREGKGYLLALILLAALGLALRLWNLDGLPPYIDELNHLNAAKDLAQGLSLDQVAYRRSIFTVTLPVAWFFKLFGVNLWAARLSGVLVNVLALIPLYLLCKRINKPIALIAVGLFVFSPWMIAAGRNVREYAYYPLIFYGTALIMVRLYEALPNRIIFQRDYRIFLQWKNLFYVGVLVFGLYFVVALDTYSTLKVLLILYPVFGLLLLRKVDWHERKNIAITLSVLAIGIIFLVTVFNKAGGQFLRVNAENRNFAFFPLLFFEKPAQQWYYNRPLISLVIFALALLATYLWDRRKFVLPFSLLTFLGGLLAFSSLFLKGERPRYAINIEFWFIILMAAGLFIAILIGETILKGRYRWAVWIILLLLFWNFPQTFTAGLYAESGWHPITDEYHADIASALSFLKSNAAQDDAIVTTIYVDSYADFYAEERLSDDKLIIYDHTDPLGSESIYRAMDTYKNGWIALDYPRGFLWSQPVPLHDFVYKDKQVEFLGWHGDVYILKWDGE